MRSKTFLVETETEEEDGANVYGYDDDSFNFQEFLDEKKSNVHGARQPGGHQNKGWPSPGK